MQTVTQTLADIETRIANLKRVVTERRPRQSDAIDMVEVRVRWFDGEFRNVHVERSELKYDATLSRLGLLLFYDDSGAVSSFNVVKRGLRCVPLLDVNGLPGMWFTYNPNPKESQANSGFGV